MRPVKPWIVSLSVRIYQLLLKLGPADFRAEYSNLMLHDFYQYCQDVYQEYGTSGVIKLCVPMFGDAIMDTFSEQCRQPRLWWPTLLSLIIALFPFYWISACWPGFGTLFFHVFATTNDHLIGHSLLFCMVALLLFCTFPSLSSRPKNYLLLMLFAILVEETLHKLHLPTFVNSQDLLYDFYGIVIGYIILKIWRYSTLHVSQ